ncbi:hypothetical protein RSAG8_11492, partial [Rhizoctonia solani AG-8 WAC10335]
MELSPRAARHLNPSQVREKARSSNKRERKRAVEKARDLLLFGCATYEAKEICTWPAERVLEEASKLEEEILENNDGTVWLVNLDRRQQTRTGDASHYEGKVPNLSDEKIESEGWTILTTGTIYGYRIIEKKKRLVFAARFRPYLKMSEEGWRAAYEALFRFGLYKKARNGRGTREEYMAFLKDMDRASV